MRVSGQTRTTVCSFQLSETPVLGFAAVADVYVVVFCAYNFSILNKQSITFYLD